ncbi:MAG: gamma-glutamyl-gamma-aminobutyrate hydrolase family protein [Candidatus Microsaccharimonas sp.]
MKPIIGITTGEIINQTEPWSSTIYGQKRTYSDAVVAAGGVPVFIPFVPEDVLKALYNQLDGIVFAGGNDIDPQLYNEAQHPLTVDISPERDRVETTLMTWALNDDKPIFAICRGFQLLNVHLNGNLYQDILTEYANASDHQLSTFKKDYTHIAHQLRLAPKSRLAAITKELTLATNTHHHQGIKKLADGLEASAWAEDGIIEAIEHPKRSFVLGVQCHPESLYKNDEKWAAVFRAFVQAASSL